MANDYHNDNFFITAWRAYQANLVAAVLIAVGIMAAEWFARVSDSRLVEFVGPIVLVTTFAFAIHQTILFGPKEGLKTLFAGNHSNRFFWRSMIFLALLYVIVVVIFMCVYIVFSAATTGRAGGPDVLNGFALIALLVVGVPLFGASLAMWGTMLPASVANTDASLAAAWRRGKVNFGYTFLRLAIGPFFVQILIFAVAFTVAFGGVPVAFQIEGGAFDPIGASVYLFFQMGNLFVTALTASVLCKTYLRSQDEAPPSAS